MQVFSARKDKPKIYPFLTPHDDYKPFVPLHPIELSISPDGKEWHSIYDQDDLDGVLCYMHSPSAVTQTDNTEKLGINDGQRLNSSTYSNRELTMSFWFSGADEADMYLAFDALQRFLDTREPYWICWEDWPQRMYYGKSKLSNPTYTSDKGWTCTVTFTDLIGLSRSVGTSTSYVLGIGNNALNEQPSYEFNSNNFSVINQSDVLIDPERRGHPFKMILEGSSQGNMRVTNKTTGDSISRTNGWSGKWELDEVNPMLNGNHDGINTDHGIITLQIGNNDFLIENFSGKVTFDFPFWWKS